ncbi:MULTISPECIES: ATP-binding cassette domain-containing protein [Aerococcus]|uniref:DUF3744 domain-containing protein n=1 Tax=Aerococcus urinae (strain CCUG 59500 / ACS-120-V-Col10a) TaxID=2976812 RepID=UPI000200FBBD|nr:DUF3744 domain-containing protein [Aerococcus sp. Group 1]AEA01076.1 ABC transporter, ATP-binding protein [Aerococcus sp. Group 1]MCY3031093.1 DUF3744 domain-containing protein [Aerococcus sp. Group 1]MCY3054185.1 DUF3744 domain-containing protein [Aerococcus sp. Group 1]MCY3055915.1 DUF3744 domain-containing protein [Aerococcus sp. Group 1]MCY3061638.1 DUF3744 domain-containing protein [Aerococcus sp. Group 1]
MSSPWIQMRHFSYRYPRQYRMALRDINITLNHGEKILILGANESGKSTFLKALKGELPEDGEFSGEIIHSGESAKPVDGTAIRDVIDEKIDDNPNESVNHHKKAIEKRWYELVDCELQPEEYQALSRGEKEIHRMSHILKEDNEIYIFDEPLKTLAPKQQKVFIDIIDDYHVHTDATIIISEHQLEAMMSRPIDRVLVFSEGRIVFDGQLKALLESGILNPLGIREPFYITAMRYAAYPLKDVYNIQDVHHIFGPQLRQKIENWIMTLPRFRYQENKEVLLELDNVSALVNNRNQRGLHNINLKINQEEMLSVVGPNGSGKTLLAQLCSGSLRPQTGTIKWLGQELPLDQFDHLRRNVGLITNDDVSNISQSRAETVADYLAQSSVLVEGDCQDDELKDKFNQVLAMVNLDNLLDFPLDHLSEISKLRLAMARSLLKDPKLLVVEEITEGRDFVHFRAIMNTLQRLNSHYQIAIMMTTHDIEVMLEYSRRTLIMSEGHLIIDALPVDVATMPAYLNKAGLRETSLTTFARQLDLVDPYTFIRKFVDYDREMQQNLD